MRISVQKTKSDMVNGWVLRSGGDCGKDWVEVEDGKRRKNAR